MIRASFARTPEVTEPTLSSAMFAVTSILLATLTRVMSDGVESIDRDMAGSPELASRLRDGLAQLNKAAGGDFTAVTAEVQVEAMKKLEGTAFFSDMLNKTQFYFYNNKAVWSKFGYEGSSWEKGGYINRGFNDVEWTHG